jgi:hypothetical protein
LCLFRWEAILKEIKGYLLNQKPLYWFGKECAGTFDRLFETIIMFMNLRMTVANEKEIYTETKAE